MNDILKMKNIRSFEMIKTDKGAPQLFKFTTSTGETRLAIISKREVLGQRKTERSLFKEISRYNSEAPKVISLIKEKRQSCLLLEWKDCLFMDNIVEYYKKHI